MSYLADPNGDEEAFARRGDPQLDDAAGGNFRHAHVPLSEAFRIRRAGDVRRDAGGARGPGLMPTPPLPAEWPLVGAQAPQTQWVLG